MSTISSTLTTANGGIDISLTSPQNSSNYSLPSIGAGNATGQPGGPSNEVLANFFKSLIENKKPSGATSPNSSIDTREVEAPVSSSPLPARSRRPTISRKDPHKEDRLRQLTNKP